MRVRLLFVLVLLAAPTLTGCAANVCLVGGVAYGSLLAGGVVYGAADSVHQRHVEAKKSFDRYWSRAMSAAVTSSDGELAQDVRSLSDGPSEQHTEDLMQVLVDYGTSGIHADGALSYTAVWECAEVATRITSDPKASARLVALARKYGPRCEADEKRASLDESLPHLQGDLAIARDRAAGRQWLWLVPSLDGLQSELARERAADGDGATPAQRGQLAAIQRAIDELRARSVAGVRAVAAYHADPRVQSLESDLQMLQAQLDLYSSELGHASYVRSQIANPSTGTLDERIGDLVTITGGLQAQIGADDAALSDLSRALGAMP